MKVGKPLVIHITTVHPSFDVRIFQKECRTLAKSNFRLLLLATHDRNEEVDGVQIRALPKPKNRFDRMTRIMWHAYRESIRQPAGVRREPGICRAHRGGATVESAGEKGHL